MSNTVTTATDPAGNVWVETHTREIVKGLFDDYGGRKFMLNAITLLIGTGLRIADLIDTTAWLTVIGIAVGGYTAVEGAADMIGRAKSKGDCT